MRSITPGLLRFGAGEKGKVNQGVFVGLRLFLPLFRLGMQVLSLGFALRLSPNVRTNLQKYR
jgi:hypothetical protein